MADVTLNIRHNADQATSSVKSLSNAMGSFASNSAKASKSGNAAANGFAKIGKACLSAGKSATKGASGLGKFVSSLKRIAFYRAIRSAIRYVTDSLKQGLDAAYNWSKQQGGQYAMLYKAMDNLSAASGRMKLQLGAAFGGLITAIEPILIRIINLVTAAADAITRFFAVLNGSGYYKKAVGSLDDVGNAASGAGKKVKGLLASWDELNVIGKESGGGGGGSNSTDYSGMYEWAEAESDWANLFASGNFFVIGEKIGDALGNVAQKLTNFLKKPEVQNFGKNLADALNGAVSDPSNWESIGETIGTAIGTATKWVVEFFTGIDWNAVKVALTAFVTGLKTSIAAEFETIDFGLDEDFLDNWAETGLEALKDFAVNLLYVMGFDTAAYNLELFADKVKAALGLVSEYYNGFIEALESSRLYAVILGWERGITEFDKEFKQWGLSIAQTIQDSWALRRFFGDQSGTILNLSVGIEADNEKLQELGQKIEELVEAGEKGINIDAHVDHEKVDQYKETLKTPFKTSVNAEVGEKVDPKNLFTHNSGVTSPSGNTLALGMPIRIKPEVDNPVNVNVGLKKDGWDTVSLWVDKNYSGGSVWKAVELWRGNFTTAQKWVDGKYSGGSIWKAVELWRGNFTNAQKWVDDKYSGGSVWKAVELWRGNFTTVQKWISEKYLGGVVTEVINVVAKLTNAAELKKSIKDAMNGIKININSTVDGVRKNIGKINTVAEYANGGFPVAGDLFLANEAGPEYVGSIGSNTAVANNDQIVAGIQSGVAQANAEQNELLRQQNSILMQLLNKDLTITPSVALGQVVARSTALYGRA